MALSHSLSSVATGLIMALDAANVKSVPVFSVEVLVVAGGGGGAGRHGGGGGGGGVRYSSAHVLVPGTAVTVTVGTGGTGSINVATDGGNSVFNTLTALGGTAGRTYGPGDAQKTGGSGGGGSGGSPDAQAANLGTAGQGYNGGAGSASTEAGGGGGGGGGAGTAASGSYGGAGGPGIMYNISGTPAWYAGGGAGGTSAGVTATGAKGGVGGGGNGGDGPNDANVTPGTPNTGGGGGASRTIAGVPGREGGSGIVIVRYPGPQKASGGTVTSVDGYTIHTFTSTGSTTFTPIATWYDMCRSGYNGTLTNSPTYNSSNQGSLLFNGTSNYLTLSSSVGAFGQGNFTISCWWKSNGSQSNYVAIIEQGFTGSPVNGAWAFKVSHTSGDFNFTYYNNGISDNLSSYNPNDGLWHNLVAVRTGTTLILYRDNVSVKTITLPTGFSFGEGSSIFVGYNPRDGSYLKGYLPILQVYNRDLSSSELQQNYNAMRVRFGV